MRIVLLLVLSSLSCGKKNISIYKDSIRLESNPEKVLVDNKDDSFSYDYRTIHVIVALCDNKYQGIVPVGRVIGNGQDPGNNLYWGARYGVKNHFKLSKEWSLKQSNPLNDTILERIVFKHSTKNVYLIADAYNGKYIQKATEDFLNSSAGNLKNTLQYNDKTLGTNGNSELICYIGHDGLMDFSVEGNFSNTDGKKRNVMILACYSKHFFQPILANANTNNLLWSTGLMAPEAYVLHDAIRSYLNNENGNQIANAAAKAYDKYQHCGYNAARRLLVSN